jgi:flagellar basal body rod protein FlgB
MLHTKEETILNGLLNASSERQQLLANNLSGARVEGYVGRDLDFSTVMVDLNHSNGVDKSKESMLNRATFEYAEGPISTEQEMAKMYKNHVAYILLTRINGHIYQHMEEATQSGRAA